MTSYPGQFAFAARRTMTWLFVASFVVAGALTGIIVSRAFPSTAQSPATVQVADETPPGSGVDPRFPVHDDPNNL
jgi:hypothetical protein